MCWSIEASAGFAVAGAVGAAYAYKKDDSALLWIPLLYFALMEALQAMSYPTLNHCDVYQNQLLTYLSYLHVVFQPFFINAVYLYFIPVPVRHRIQPFVYTVCFVAAVLLLVRVYPFAWAGHCPPGQIMCGARMCTVSGHWHLAWLVPLTGLLSSYPIYMTSVFLLPLVYGSWRAMIFVFLSGPLPALLLTSNTNEQPAVWCFFSVSLIALLLWTPLREWVRVKTFFLWPRAWLHEHRVRPYIHE